MRDFTALLDWSVNHNRTAVSSHPLSPFPSNNSGSCPDSVPNLTTTPAKTGRPSIVPLLSSILGNLLFLGSVCHLDLKMMMGASEIAALPLNEGSGCQSIKALNLFLPNFNVETKPALVCLIHRFPLETLEPRQLNDLSRLFCNPSAMRSAPIPGRVVRASCCRYRRWLAPCGCCGLCSVLGLTRHQS